MSAAETIIRWQWSAFDDLAPADMYAMMAARAAVFVVEQNCPFLDPDGADPYAQHLLGWHAAPDASQPRLAAYLRLIAPGRVFVEPSIGRVLTTQTFRRRGLGTPLMREGLRHAAAAFPGHAVRIGAQRYLEHFYAGLGFRTVSAPYDEDGIEHVQMLRDDGAALIDETALDKAGSPKTR